MDDANEWTPVALAVLEEIDDVIDRRLRAFRESLDAWLDDILAGRIPADWREQLAHFVDRTAAMGLAIAPHSVDALARIIESRISFVAAELAPQDSSRRVRSQMVDGAFVQSVIPIASGPSVVSRLSKSQTSHVTHIRMANYSSDAQKAVRILGSDWKNVSPALMSRLRDAGALVDQHTGAVLGNDANSLGVEAFVRLQRRDGGTDTAHFLFVWPDSTEQPAYWKFVGLKRDAAPEREAAGLAAQQKIRHDDVLRVRGANNRFQGGMFAVIGGINGVIEGAPLLGILEAVGGAEQVLLSGADLATGKVHRAWSARGIQAVLERAGVDAETAQFLADNGGLLIALGKATVDAAGTAHAVIETSTGYRIRLEFDPATLSANGLGGAKIKVKKLSSAGGKGVTKSGTPSRSKAKASNGARPTARQSEIDIGAELEGKGYREQRSFKGGEEAPYSTKGSSRPDHNSRTVGVEVKNYNVQAATGRASLVKKVVEQAKQRVVNLPRGMRQKIEIDVRGQAVSHKVLRAIAADIVRKSNGILKPGSITFRVSGAAK